MVFAKMVLMSRNELYLVKGVNIFLFVLGIYLLGSSTICKPCVNHKSVKKSLHHAVGR